MDHYSLADLRGMEG